MWKKNWGFPDFWKKNWGFPDFRVVHVMDAGSVASDSFTVVHAVDPKSVAAGGLALLCVGGLLVLLIKGILFTGACNCKCRACQSCVAAGARSAGLVVHRPVGLAGLLVDYHELGDINHT